MVTKNPSHLFLITSQDEGIRQHQRQQTCNIKNMITNPRGKITPTTEYIQLECSVPMTNSLQFSEHIL